MMRSVVAFQMPPEAEALADVARDAVAALAGVILARAAAMHPEEAPDDLRAMVADGLSQATRQFKPVVRVQAGKAA
jgi:hypothetical protein